MNLNIFYPVSTVTAKCSREQGHLQKVEKVEKVEKVALTCPWRIYSFFSKWCEERNLRRLLTRTIGWVRASTIWTLAKSAFMFNHQFFARRLQFLIQPYTVSFLFEKCHWSIKVALSCNLMGNLLATKISVLSKITLHEVQCHFDRQ